MLKPTQQNKNISDNEIKSAVVRHIYSEFDGLDLLPRQRFKIRPEIIHQAVEKEFACSLKSKSDLISKTITSTIMNGVYDYQNKKFSTQPENGNITGNIMSTYQEDGDGLVYAFRKNKQPTQSRSSTTSRTISCRVLKNAVVKIVRDAVTASQDLSARFIRQKLENDFSCDLKERKDFILQIIHSTLMETKGIHMKLKESKSSK
jgi:hypothetical protein